MIDYRSAVLQVEFGGFWEGVVICDVDVRMRALFNVFRMKFLTARRKREVDLTEKNAFHNLNP